MRSSARPGRRLDAGFGERDLVGMYLGEISKTPLLTAVEEVELAKWIEAGLYAAWLIEQDQVPAGVSLAELDQVIAEGRAAKARFVQANLRLVVSVVRRYRRTGVDMGDLIGEGNLGLVHAVEKFDFRRGHKFSTYATWWIRQAVSRSLDGHQHLIRRPAGLQEEISRVRRAEQQLIAVLGEQPTAVQVADTLGMTADRIEDLRRWAAPVTSLDAPVGQDADSAPFGDFVSGDQAPSPEDILQAAAERQSVRGLLARLDARSARLIRLRYGLDQAEPLSLAETARQLGLSRERIRQLEIKALATLRGAVTGPGRIAVAV
ncbi:sigma-70 family RNA polymerase sigma factor [Catellatospora sp. NPDC049609]|uniref:sigma-70 family RNA polymerase sigma factor n=1 Tax=Catellatospora sp. NPDC049609 TaxID=3155505 RepID=UPI0034339D6E